MSKEFHIFTGVAVLSAIADIVTFTLLINLELYIYLSQSVARIVGGLVSFYINRTCNFNTKNARNGSLVLQGRRFILLYIISFNLSLLLIGFFYEYLQLDSLISKFMADILCFLFNFLVMKFYVYNSSMFLSKAINIFVK